MMVSDFGPAFDAEAAFQRGFKDSGGEVVGSVHFPVANPDFAAYIQRAKDLHPGVDLRLGARRGTACGHRQGFRRAGRVHFSNQDFSWAR